MKNYRGIKVINSVQMICKDGSPNTKMIRALDKLVDRLDATGDVLIEAYKGTSHKHKARCSKGHDILIKPNDYVSKSAGCQQCHLIKLHKHEKLLTDFDLIVKRHRLTQHEPFNFGSGILKGLKERYLFSCPHGEEHWISPHQAVMHTIFKCHCDMCWKGE
ncbi:hypothetical protein VE23_05935 [Paenibacillus sp. D9]|nr:hypothetical protein VE23_05935 [Paenibacillus sp. D9]